MWLAAANNSLRSARQGPYRDASNCTAERVVMQRHGVSNHCRAAA
jgi:hypothetical protein